MAKRQWKNLDQGTTYIITAGDGWALSKNTDGTVSLAYTGTAAQANNVDLAMDPDPGAGNKYPPTEP
ncbi:MAG TPA: hypothetical protein VFF76_11890 [Holophagaceae bacterium]|nr:hypothetical protein [Holophagaceae bacterium]